MWSEKGASLMELVVVVGVSAIVVGALVFATIASLRNAQFSKNQAQATKLAQEGIEWVRSGRDRNKDIEKPFLKENVDNWQDPDLWTKIDGNCGDTKSTDAKGEPHPTYCYFNISSDGILKYFAVGDDIPSGAEEIGVFKRAVILSDDATKNNPGTSASQKNVTVIVSWTDFSGPHQSKLTTILRKI